MLFSSLRLVFLSFTLLLWLFSSPLCPRDAVLHMQGYINQEKIDELKTEIEKASLQKNDKVYFIIQSLSGNQSEVLEFAKSLYELHEKNEVRYVVYILDNAIGSSAIIPFLADELYVSPTVSWGAISSSSESGLPINVLQSSVQGLISLKNPHFSTLKLLSEAMCDPQVTLSENGELHYATEQANKRDQKTLNRKGETLVLNRYELETLHLVREVMPYQDFLTKFLPQEKNTLLEKGKVLEPAQKEMANLDQKLSQYVHIKEGEKNRVGRILINDMKNGISESTWIYVNSALSEYKKTKPICIILELNTPGGEVFAAQRISDALKEMDTQYGIPVVAYINNWAISAGAMLAYSSRFIVSSKDASMGAAEPVYLGEAGQMQTASEKVNSALRTDFANRAKFFGRNPFIAEAMVDKDTILVKRHGEIIKLDSEDQIRKGGIDPDIIISPKGKLLTLSADELVEYGVADSILNPIKLPEEAENQNLVPISSTAFSQIPFFQKIPSCFVDTFVMNWQTRFLAFLSLPAITSILFLGMLVCFYVEISASTFGFAGVIGLLCLFFILLSSFALEAIHWLEPILLLFGLFLVGLEVFFFPTLGILAIIGGILALVGLLGMMLPGIQSVSFNGEALNAAGEYVLNRLGWLSGALLVAVLLILFLSRFIRPHLKMMNRLVLQDTELLKSGTHEMHARLAIPEVRLNVGETAEVSMTLRPAGKIFAHGQEFDAISTGSFIEKGKTVTIKSVEGEKIMVEETYR